MTKSETREVAKLAKAMEMGMTDYAARGLSALVRSSMTARSHAQLLQQARNWGIAYHPEFII